MAKAGTSLAPQALAEMHAPCWSAADSPDSWTQIYVDAAHRFVTNAQHERLIVQRDTATLPDCLKGHEKAVMHALHARDPYLPAERTSLKLIQLNGLLRSVPESRQLVRNEGTTACP